MLAASAAQGWVSEEVKPKKGSNRGANTGMAPTRETDGQVWGV